MDTKTVRISLKVLTDKPDEDLQKKIQSLLDHGGVRDCFDAAGLDAANFVVESVEDS